MLARRLDAPLIALHTGDDQLPLATQDRACAEAKDLLGQQLERCPGGMLDVELVIKRGPVAETILRAASEYAAQLLVLGRHHQRNPELFVGTTLERVSRLSSVPALLVASEGSCYDSGLLALDFSTCSSEALRCAALLLQGGKLHALHMCNPPLGARLAGPAAREAFMVERQETLSYLLEDELETLDLIGTPRPITDLKMQSGELRALLEQEIEQNQPGFIALGSHSRSSMGEALLGSLALALLREPPCDVLVAR
jgi:nucleotide-binding universal stress UspA family protein